MSADILTSTLDNMLKKIRSIAMPYKCDKVYEILDRAATEPITTKDLSVLIAKTRELSYLKEHELKRLQVILNELESHIHLY